MSPHSGGLAVSSSKTLEFTKMGERWDRVKEVVGNGVAPC